MIILIHTAQEMFEATLLCEDHYQGNYPGKEVFTRNQITTNSERGGNKINDLLLRSLFCTNEKQNEHTVPRPREKGHFLDEYITKSTTGPQLHNYTFNLSCWFFHS